MSDMLRRDSGFQWRLCVESIWSGKSKPTRLGSQKPDDEIEKRVRERATGHRKIESGSITKRKSMNWLGKKNALILPVLFVL